MWIAGVDIPMALIEAHQDDRLVIFVSPALPLRHHPIYPISADWLLVSPQTPSVTVTSEDLDRTDTLLGDLEDRHGVDVHRRVTDTIGARHRGRTRYMRRSLRWLELHRRSGS